MNKLNKIICSGITLILLVTVLLSFQKKEGFVITGTIKNLPDGTMLEMVPIDLHKKEKPVDSAKVSDGKFILKGEVATPRLYRIKPAGDTYSGFNIMVDNENIKVSATARQVSDNGEKSYEFSDVKITGSKANRLFEAKTAFHRHLNSLYQQYHEDNKSIIDQLQQARTDKDSVSYKKLVASDGYKKFEQDEKNFFDTVKATIEREVLANKNTWWGPFLMFNQYSYFTPAEKKLYEQFSPRLHQ